MATIADVYRVIDEIKVEGIVEDYAVGGGMAALFYSQTALTFDIDVFVIIEQQGILIDLSPIYRWAQSKGFEVRGEHLVLHSVPVQVLVANEGLEKEAIRTAKMMKSGDVDVPVMRPEYLIASYIKTGGKTRRARTFDLFGEDFLDKEKLKDIFTRYSLWQEWYDNGGEPL